MWTYSEEQMQRFENFQTEEQNQSKVNDDEKARETEAGS